MQVINLPATSITSPEWNPNFMDDSMRGRLLRSIERFGIVVPLVVRKIDSNSYETIGGAQRLSILRETDTRTIACVVVEADDTESRLLAQALNRIQGEDDLGLRADALRQILSAMPQSEVLSILPESAESLQSLVSLGQVDMAEHIRAWQQAQAARLRHLTFQLSGDQLELVEKALSKTLPDKPRVFDGLSGEYAVASSTEDDSSPNRRGTALAEICRHYLENMGGG